MLTALDVQALAREELRRRNERRTAAAKIEQDWRPWLLQMFPLACFYPFASHHAEFWEWLWSIRLGQRSSPFVGVWPRGGGKSSSAEIGVVAVGARRLRRYAVYVSGTQEQADNRVENVASLLESSAVGSHYPEMGRRALGKFGQSKGWRRNRLRTAQGFIVDALGLDTASARGLKVEQQRPDMIVLDDVDALHDTSRATQKKVDTITQTILPIGSEDCTVLAVQNQMLPNGVFSQLVRGEAGFLSDRHVSGPVPAVRGLKLVQEAQRNGVIRHVIKGGEPTWAGQSLQVCQQLIDNAGLRAFLREQQHQVDEVEGALWKRRQIRHLESLPEDDPIVRSVVGVDPSGGGTHTGIVGAALLKSGRVVILGDDSQPGAHGPANWANHATQMHDELQADAIAAEVNFGGDMVKATITAANDHVRVVVVRASRGKQVRAEPVVQKYADGYVLHLGVFPDLEAEMTQWVPGVSTESPNRVDAMVWAVTELLWPSEVLQSGGSMRVPFW